MRKRLLSIFMVLAMLLSMLPTMSFATETENPITVSDVTINNVVETTPETGEYDADMEIPIKSSDDETNSEAEATPKAEESDADTGSSAEVSAADDTTDSEAETTPKIEKSDVDAENSVEVSAADNLTNSAVEATPETEELDVDEETPIKSSDDTKDSDAEATPETEELDVDEETPIKSSDDTKDSDAETTPKTEKSDADMQNSVEVSAADDETNSEAETTSETKDSDVNTEIPITVLSADGTKNYAVETTPFTSYKAGFTKRNMPIYKTKVIKGGTLQISANDPNLRLENMKGIPFTSKTSKIEDKTYIISEKELINYFGETITEIVDTTKTISFVQFYSGNFFGKKYKYGLLIQIDGIKNSGENNLKLVNTSGGNITSKWKNGETHILTATPDELYSFDRWEYSKDNGKTWNTNGELDATCEVTLEQDTCYRAIFNPIDVTLSDLTYALTSNSKDAWYMNVVASYSKKITNPKTITVNVYEGEPEEDNLLGTYETSSGTYAKSSTIKAKIDTRPSSTKSKIYMTVQVGNLEPVFGSITLCGTLDITSAQNTVNTSKSIFLDNINTLQLSASGIPETKDITWSGGSDVWKKINSSKVDENGLVTFTLYDGYSKDTFVADAGDGRVAYATLNFKPGDRVIKLDETSLSIAVGDSQEYAAVHSQPDTCVKNDKVSVISSDENVFTAEILTHKVSDYNPDVVDKIKINGISPGSGTLTIKVGEMEWSCPVNITNTNLAVKSINISQSNATIKTNNTQTLNATIEPELATVIYEWKSSNPKVATVDKNGVVTAKTKGKTIITVRAMDANKNIVEANCTVTVPDEIYNMKVYIPKNIVGEEGINFYPTKGFDSDNHDIFNENSEITQYTKDSSGKDYDVYTLSLHEGTYSFRAKDSEKRSLGGGAFSVPAETTGSKGNECNIYLRLAECWITNTYDSKKATANDFSVILQNKIGVVTMGDAYTGSDGYVRYPALIYVNGNALLYYSALEPSADYMKTHNVNSATRKEDAFLRDTSVLPFKDELPGVTAFTINAPVGAEVAMYNQILNFNTKRIDSDKEETLNDGTVDHIFYITRNINMSYRVSMEGKVTKAGYSAAVDGDRLVVKLEDDDSIKHKSNNQSAYKESSLIMNINERNKLEMSVGEKYKLRSYRASWEILKDICSNIMIEPDFHYNVLSGSDVISIEPVDGGNAGDNWAWITAKKKGIAIVEVTYDPIDINGISYTGDGLYNATDPLRTGVFVATVDNNTGNINCIDWDAEYNTCYFLDDTGELTISPIGNDVTVSTATVCNGQLGILETVTDVNGSFNVPIAKGNNVVKITADGVTDYRIVRGAKLNAVVESNEEREEIYPGDEVTLSFEGLYQNIPKLSGIYNPGFPNTMAICYKMDDTNLKSKGFQYQLIEKKYHQIKFVVPADAKGPITLTKGKIIGTSMGDVYGKHRQITDIGVSANFNASETQLEEIELPNINIMVTCPSNDEAKKEAKEVINRAFAHYESSKYTTGNWTKIVAAKDAGLAAIEAAESLSVIMSAKKTALLAMSSVEIKGSGSSGGSSGNNKTHTKSYYSTKGLDFDLTADNIDGYVTISFEDYGKRLNDADFKTPLGVIIDRTKVPFTKGDNIADVTVRLLDALDIKYSNTGTVDNAFYLANIKNFKLSDGTLVDSFGEFDSGSGSGWMITWNNWFINRSTAEFEVENRDIIKWQNTCQVGADIGCNWDNGSAEITGLNFEKNYGTLTPAFSQDETAYIYKIPASVKSIALEGLQENYWAKMIYTANGVNYKPMRLIPVKNGTVIELNCAFAEYAGDTPTDKDALTITIQVEGGSSVHPSQPSSSSSTIKPESSVPNISTSVTTEATMDKKGNASATVSNKAVDDVIKKNLLAAEKAKNKKAKKEVKIEVKSPVDAKKVETMIPKAAIKELEEKVDVVKLETSIATLALDKKVMENIVQTEKADVQISVAKVEAASLQQISTDVKKIIGEHPIFDFKIEVGNKNISNLGGKVRINLPYHIKANENPKKLSVCYVKDNGTSVEMLDAYYDAKTENVIFETNHFSTYAVVYDENKVAFDDVDITAWYYDAVKFAVENKLFKGTSDDVFSPNAKMTRAMLVTVLYRMSNAEDNLLEISKNPNAVAKNFTDVKGGKWYSEAVKWGSEYGIISGYSDTVFGTNDFVTREQLAVILHRYGKMAGKDVSKTSDLGVYKDTGKISGYAKDAMSYAVGSGILTGRTVDTLVAKGTATRAEVATMLMRYK